MPNQLIQYARLHQWKKMQGTLNICSDFRFTWARFTWPSDIDGSRSFL